MAGFSAVELDFYCDAFWVFAYSTFDLVAHVVNVVHPRVQDESLVSFERARQDYGGLGAQNKNSSSMPAALVKLMETVARQDYFERLKKFRQCVLHRRVVCIAPYSMEVPEFYNYNTTSTAPTLLGRFVCDDPEDLKPQFTEQRKLDDDCQTIKDALMIDLQKLLRKI